MRTVTKKETDTDTTRKSPLEVAPTTLATFYHVTLNFDLWYGPMNVI